MRKSILPLGVGLVVLVVWFLIRPPRFWLNLTRSVEPSAAAGAQLVDDKGCRGCHRIGGEGALKAPALDRIVQRQVEEDPALVSLRLWLRNPRSVKPNTAMPDFRLSDSQIEAILLYLQEQALDRQ